MDQDKPLAEPAQKKNPLPDTVILERLARIAGMLGSAHEGERATAAQIASAMLNEMGLTSAEVIHRGLSAGACPQAHQRRAPPHDTPSPSPDQPSPRRSAGVQKDQAGRAGAATRLGLTHVPLHLSIHRSDAIA